MSTLSANTLQLMQRYWQAANYLSAAQIYLQDNPLLREPLRAAHIKPRLLGHWGTSPGLNLIYVHLNRLIKDTNAEVLFICGPGHGAPALLANTYLEGTYSEVYPDISRDEAGLRRLFTQFSSPGGVPSHVSPHTPGSIHEGGELGYSLAHAFGAAFDHPDLIVACVVGDGEAETAPLEGSWKSIHFLNPLRDGAVLPILHLNGYKISSPTVMARMPDDALAQLFSGLGYEAIFVGGDDPMDVHEALADALDKAYHQIRYMQSTVRGGQPFALPRWPLIILRTLKGWTGPASWNGQPIEGTFRSHQVPLTEVRENPAQLALLEQWLRSYAPTTLFDEHGTLLPELQALAPKGPLRMGATPYANGGLLLRQLQMPDFMDYAVPVQTPGAVTEEGTTRLGNLLRDIFTKNKDEHHFRLFSPDETNSNRLGAVFEATERMFTALQLDTDEQLSPEGRVMEVLSEHLCQGWLEGYLLTGGYGLFASYEAFITIIDSMFSQHAKWLKMCREIPWRKDIASLNYLLTSHSWRQDHNGYSHQGPGFIDTVVNKKSTVIRIFLPPDANCLLAVMDHCLCSRNLVNVVVAGKQPMLQWLSAGEAAAHCSRGASVWEWAGNDAGQQPDVVLACAGDVPTLETVAAAWLLRQQLPDLKVRVVNVVNLLALSPEQDHPHGATTEYFRELFTDDAPVIFAFHGYVRLIHDLVHGRPRPTRFHARGFMEEGTTTTPFDMTVLNNMSRYHLAIAAVERAAHRYPPAEGVIKFFENKLAEHRHYIREHLEDMPEIRDWHWS
ncbi:phosphoketolase family protein [Chitinophaga vietnamensis]|uniref:phosphoketolase family protein n=1 Tax=Chitinophaga vietnamensis TaxID=2593957 RepID=UPI001177696D|nr:phosphoketolase family protein [Chitinophaga vietnamensis]